MTHLFYCKDFSLNCAWRIESMIAGRDWQGKWDQVVWRKSWQSSLNKEGQQNVFLFSLQFAALAWVFSRKVIRKWTKQFHIGLYDSDCICRCVPWGMATPKARVALRLVPHLKKSKVMGGVNLHTKRTGVRGVFRPPSIVVPTDKIFTCDDPQGAYICLCACGVE